MCVGGLERLSLPCVHLGVSGGGRDFLCLASTWVCRGGRRVQIPGQEDLLLGPPSGTQSVWSTTRPAHVTYTCGCQMAFSGPVPGFRCRGGGSKWCPQCGEGLPVAVPVC